MLPRPKNTALDNTTRVNYTAESVGPSAPPLSMLSKKKWWEDLPPPGPETPPTEENKLAIRYAPSEQEFDDDAKYLKEHENATEQEFNDDSYHDDKYLYPTEGGGKRIRRRTTRKRIRRRTTRKRSKPHRPRK